MEVADHLVHSCCSTSGDETLKRNGQCVVSVDVGLVRTSHPSAWVSHVVKDGICRACLEDTTQSAREEKRVLHLTSLVCSSGYVLTETIRVQLCLTAITVPQDANSHACGSHPSNRTHFLLRAHYIHQDAFSPAHCMVFCAPTKRQCGNCK